MAARTLMLSSIGINHAMVLVAVACACRVGVVSVACERAVMTASVLGLLESESVVSVVHGLGSESHQG